MFFDSAIVGIAADKNTSIGAIDHEFGHNLGLHHENCGPDLCDDEINDLEEDGLDPSIVTQGPMCNSDQNDNGGWPNKTLACYQFEKICKRAGRWILEC